MYFLSINWNPSEGIDLGFFMIRYYSLMFVIAFVLGWYIMKKIFISENISLQKLDTLFIYTVVATLVGARLGHFLFYEPEVFLEDPLSIILPVQFDPFKFVGFRGLASHGAAIAIIIAMYMYSRKVLKTNILWILDRVVIPVAFAAIFIRIGNFMNSEIIGIPTESSYGVVFKALGETFPRHPVQLYESSGYLISAFILWLVYWKTAKKDKVGYLFGLFLVLLWSVRFIAEFFKKEQGGLEELLGLFSTGQWLSIPFIIIGLYFMFKPAKEQIQ